MPPNAKTIQKPTTVPPHISINNGQMGTFQVPILCTCTVGRHMSHIKERYVYLDGGGAWWSIRNHGQIVFLAIYSTCIKISNTLELYLEHSTYDSFLCTWAKKEGKNVKANAIPTKSHSAAVLLLPCPNFEKVRQEFIFTWCLVYFFQPPNSLSLFYWIISCIGRAWTGKKYAKLAYFQVISGNSGVQKGTAFMELLFLICHTYLLSIINNFVLLIIGAINYLNYSIRATEGVRAYPWIWTKYLWLSKCVRSPANLWLSKCVRPLQITLGVLCITLPVRQILSNCWKYGYFLKPHECFHA